MKKQQAIFISVKKHLPLHYKKCQSCLFQKQLLSIDKRIENNSQRLNEYFDKSNRSGATPLSEDIKQELITHGVIPTEYSNYQIILKRE